MTVLYQKTWISLSKFDQIRYMSVNRDTHRAHPEYWSNIRDKSWLKSWLHKFKIRLFCTSWIIFSCLIFLYICFFYNAHNGDWWDLLWEWVLVALHMQESTEAHVSDDLTVNQSWNVTSDVCLCLSEPPALKRNWIYLGCLVFERVRWQFKYATIN